MTELDWDTQNEPGDKPQIIGISGIIDLGPVSAKVQFALIGYRQLRNIESTNNVGLPGVATGL